MTEACAKALGQHIHLLPEELKKDDKGSYGGYRVNAVTKAKIRWRAMIAASQVPHG